MTRTLVLVRHAKTERSDPGGDHERALTERGRADATEAGRVLVEDLEVAPDLVVVSTAVRARQTWAEMAEHPALTGVEVVPDRRIYQAEPAGLLAVLRELPEERTAVVLVGHAPGVPDLAALLTGGGDGPPPTGPDGGRHLPTMGCVLLTTDEPWAHSGEGTAVLRQVVVPRGR